MLIASLISSKWKIPAVVFVAVNWLIGYLLIILYISIKCYIHHRLKKSEETYTILAIKKKWILSIFLIIITPFALIFISQILAYRLEIKEQQEELNNPKPSNECVKKDIKPTIISKLMSVICRSRIQKPKSKTKTSPDNNEQKSDIDTDSNATNSKENDEGSDGKNIGRSTNNSAGLGYDSGNSSYLGNHNFRTRARQQMKFNDSLNKTSKEDNNTSVIEQVKYNEDYIKAMDHYDTEKYLKLFLSDKKILDEVQEDNEEVPEWKRSIVFKDNLHEQRRSVEQQIGSKIPELDQKNYGFKELQLGEEPKEI